MAVQNVRIESRIFSMYFGEKKFKNTIPVILTRHQFRTYYMSKYPTCGIRPVGQCHFVNSEKFAAAEIQLLLNGIFNKSKTNVTNFL